MSLPPSDRMPRQVTFDERAILLDGERTLLLSGAIHYPRSTPALWPTLIQRSREAGLNTIETYVFWNLHERRRGVYDFSDRLDLPRFCALVQEAGMNMALRIGPYICAETNYGGFPTWLRDVPGMRMRTDNEPFKREMARWVRFLVEQVRPFLAPQGGPIILAQLENEYNLVRANYGEAGQRYLDWVVELGRSLALGVPLIMCVGAAEGAIETINGFYAHAELDDHFARHHDQPALWTENWPGWYDTYGVGHHARTPQNVAYAVARFIAGGGSGVNYYMWHGGTNFERSAMYLQTTSYDFDAPLDEAGLPTTKARHLARLHATLTRNAALTLTSPRAIQQTLGPQQRAFVYLAPDAGDEPLTFLCNDDPTAEARVSFEGRPYTLAPRSVLVLEGETVAFDSAQIAQEDVIARAWGATGVTLQGLASWQEPTPERWPTPAPRVAVAAQPVEQLALTGDDSDYCWYSTTLRVPAGAAEGRGELRLEGVADLVAVYVDGRLVATTPTPLKENRGRLDGEDFIQSFPLDLTAGEHALSLLCCALGLIKGDWQIGNQNMAEERKGLWGRALWNGEALGGDRDPWTMRPALLGERSALFGDGAGLAPWRAWQAGEPTDRPLVWWQAEFDSPAAGDEAALALDLTGMTKGLLWLNGRLLGRYWLEPGIGDLEEWQALTIQLEGIGEPSQRLYALPAEWLRARNTLTLFDELGGDPASVRLVARR